MIRTLRISFALRNTYRVNSILYALKQIPLIKKLLPDRMYQVHGLKVFANVIAAIWELISAFAGKFLYLFAMVGLPGILYKEVAKDGLFLHILFWLTLIGGFTNTYLFNPSKDKYYAIVLLRMNAKGYTLVNYAYSMVKIIVGFSALGLIFGIEYGVPVWQCLILPLFVAGVKLTFSGYILARYDKTQDAFSENKLSKYHWILTGILLAVAYGLPAIKIVMPPTVTIVLMLVPIITGSMSIGRILRFLGYREIYAQILNDRMMLMTSRNNIISYQQNCIIQNTNITSNKQGFEYLNDLFIKRHKKILWRASKRIVAVVTVLFLVVLLVCYLNPKVNKQLNAYLQVGLPYFVFIMYAINRGTPFTNALFMNCDHSLLTYSFYKKPEMILALFRIRLREIIKINLLPALAIATGVDIMLYVTGGTTHMIHYVIIAVSILCMSIFFSIHYLTIYYLLQPYNIHTELKSATYQIVLTITYVICYALLQVKVSIMLFGLMTILFCIVYVIVAFALIYQLAPKTFRFRI